MTSHHSRNKIQTPDYGLQVPASLLALSRSFSWLQPQWPSFCSLRKSNLCPPQDICTCYSQCAKLLPVTTQDGLLFLHYRRKLLLLTSFITKHYCTVLRSINALWIYNVHLLCSLVFISFQLVWEMLENGNPHHILTTLYSTIWVVTICQVFSK